MAINVTLSKTTMDAIDMQQFSEHSAWSELYYGYMQMASGIEHYRLITSVSQQLPSGSKMADVGTYFGASAVCMTVNPDVAVTTYDIIDHIPSYITEHPNLERKIMRGQDDIEYIATTDVVLLDIDPHNGTEETEFVSLLSQNGFRGLLILDDIALNDDMKTFWNNIPETLTKYDITSYGHWSGTGIVVFDPTYIDVTLA